MFKTALKNSVPVRAFRTLRRMYLSSLIAAFVGAHRRAYEQGITRRFVERLLDSETTSTTRSRWAALLTYLNSALARMGRALEHVTDNSAIVRFWRSNSLRHSVFYKVVFSRGVNRLIVVFFSLYLPIDWGLRTYSPIAIAASMWDEAFLIFGLVYVLFQRMAARPAMEHRANPLDMPIVAFFGIGIMLVGIVSPSLSIAVSGLRAVVQYMVWFFVLTRIIEDDSDLLIFCGTLSIIGIFVALHGLYQYVVGVPIPEHWVSQAEEGVRTRVFSIFGSPNIMGSFLIMSAAPTVAFAYYCKNNLLKLTAWGGVALMGLACLLTFSRGAWLGFAVCAAVFAWLKDKRLIALILLGVGVAVFALPDVVNRITFLFTDEFAQATKFGGREGRWREGMILLNSKNPLFGYGLGRFGGAVAMQNQTQKMLTYFYMDNYYMKTLVEMGYVGAASYIALVVATLFTGLRAVYRTKNTRVSSFAAALTAAIAGVLVHCFTENIFEVPYMNAYFWGMVAMLVYVGFIRKHKKAS